jgi:hypothetical protein
VKCQDVNDTEIANAEQFIVYMYGENNLKCDDARLKMFQKGIPQEAMPPTRDAAYYHILRSRYCYNRYFKFRFEVFILITY